MIRSLTLGDSGFIMLLSIAVFVFVPMGKRAAYAAIHRGLGRVLSLEPNILH